MASLPTRGKVRVGKAAVRGKHDPTPEGYVKIFATSRSKDWKGLSPFFLGPLIVNYPVGDRGLDLGCSLVAPGTQGIVAQNLENAWQGSKIFSPADIPPGIIPSDISQVGTSFFERRLKYFSDPEPHRRVFVKKDNQTTVGAYFGGKVQQYIPSRYAYCVYYSTLVRATPEYKKLEEMLSRGINLFIVDFDGPPERLGGPVSLPEEAARFESLLFNGSSPFGHGLVLGGLLAGVEPWHQLRAYY